jgi:drug/metabolite transporter (DMT)-like permease
MQGNKPSLAYLFIKVAVAEITPISLVALRVTIAAVFLCGVVFWRKEAFPKDARTWRNLLVQAFLNSIGAWTVLAWGQQFIPSSTATVLNSTSPIFAFLMTWYLARNVPVNKVKLSGALLGMLGVILLVGPTALEGLGQQVAGQLAALLGALMYAAAALNGKKFAHLSAPVTAAGAMVCAAVCLVPLAFVFERPWELHPSSKALTAAILLSVFCTGVALLIYFRLIKTLGPLGVTSQSYLRVGFGVMLGVVFLGETFTASAVLGLVLATAGVILINRR